jgi:hypothetical protein
MHHIRYEACTTGALEWTRWDRNDLCNFWNLTWRNQIWEYAEYSDTKTEMSKCLVKTWVATEHCISTSCCIRFTPSQWLPSLIQPCFNYSNSISCRGKYIRGRGNKSFTDPNTGAHVKTYGRAPHRKDGIRSMSGACAVDECTRCGTSIF